MTAHRALILVLRFSGVVLLLAFAAVLLPAHWMAATHEWIGMGTFPRSPVVDYLARSSAALYGFHGVLILLIAGEPDRYHRIVRYLGLMDIAFGLMILAIDLHAGMPWLWTLVEGPSLVMMGVLVLFLQSRAARGARR